MTDYISREDALKWCRPEEWGTPDERWRPESEFGKMIKALPAADVKPVIHGHWIERYRDGFGNMICECSNCHSNNKRRNFCPNCGADMSEVNER